MRCSLKTCSVIVCALPTGHWAKQDRSIDRTNDLHFHRQPECSEVWWDGLRDRLRTRPPTANSRQTSHPGGSFPVGREPGAYLTLSAPTLMSRMHCIFSFPSLCRHIQTGSGTHRTSYHFHLHKMLMSLKVDSHSTVKYQWPASVSFLRCPTQKHSHICGVLNGRYWYGTDTALIRVYRP
jgi:hypothetical protein